MAETLTPYYALKKYDDGDNPGAKNLNSNWTEIDQQLRDRDLETQQLDVESQMERDANFVQLGQSSLAILQKDFFVANGLMPANKIYEAPHTFPTPTFQNLNSGTLSTSLSRTKYAPDGVHTNAANFGWSLGSAHKALIIVGMSRLRQNAAGLSIYTTVPASPTLGNTAGYQVQVDNFSSNLNLYKTDGIGGATSLVTENKILMNDAYTAQDVGMALYVNGARAIFFLRQGYSTWYPVLDVNDATYTTFSAAGINMSQNTQTMWFGCPVGIYSE